MNEITIAAITKELQATGQENKTQMAQLAQILLAFHGEIEALKELKGKITVTSIQAAAIQRAIQGRARALLEDRGLDYTRAGKTVRNAIRRDFLGTYGVLSHHDLPAHQFDDAIGFIRLWSSFKLMRSIKDRYGGGLP